MNENTIKQKFGKTIRYHRRLVGISQEELAARTELHRTYISEVERGERNISLINIIKISKGLGVNASTLFEEIEEGEHKE